MDVTGRKYASVAESAHALEPELIECLDKSGKLIRALRTEGQRKEQQQRNIEMPEGLATDPETARITHFANLLSEAYRHANYVAFSKMIELVERLSERSDSIEQRLERAEAAHRRALREQVDMEFDRAEEVVEQAKQGGDGDQIQRELFATFLQGFHAQKANGKATNGKGEL